ncbi:LOW QUALITY PROTEIN: hypothetical protein PHMEG_00023456, partial [Phytophthora megakarya]
CPGASGIGNHNDEFSRILASPQWCACPELLVTRDFTSQEVSRSKKNTGKKCYECWIDGGIAEYSKLYRSAEYGEDLY